MSGGHQIIHALPHSCAPTFRRSKSARPLPTTADFNASSFPGAFDTPQDSTGQGQVYRFPARVLHCDGVSEASMIEANPLGVDEHSGACQALDKDPWIVEVER